ncbi:hypothetical protein H0266_14360 [Halobacillus locisalis]|uniref:Uncharacterized protein n=1 Tax=Halobacillus locisalis TaxID=220753 RepID=A0A838CWT1_9BACI|nr:hypothetical protein [Halobacillus locisalis]MBA2176076.1 hypothetical protein [Halobacillus locisalis]
MKVLLLCNGLLFLGLYVYVFRVRYLLGFQLAMNVTTVASGSVGLLYGVLLISLYPFQFIGITIATALISMGVGAAFGALFDYQTLLKGMVQGFMIGVMAPMLGALATGMDLFIWFLQVVVLILMGLVFFKLKRA